MEEGDEKMEVSSLSFYPPDTLTTCEGNYMITILELKLSFGSVKYFSKMLHCPWPGLSPPQIQLAFPTRCNLATCSMEKQTDPLSPDGCIGLWHGLPEGRVAPVPKLNPA